VQVLVAQANFMRVLVDPTTLSPAQREAAEAQVYSDEKVANRDTKDWHFVIESGY
jgi:hypothetical protein